jgi:selenocysteine lyase/cysteine desulfurase
MLRIQRTKFTLPNKGTYLNCAYMSPLLKSVEKAGIQGVLRKRNPLNTAPADFFSETELLRRLFAQLIGCPEPQRVVVIPSVSYGMANVLANISLKQGDEIVVASEQFPSNVYPWQRLCQDRGGKVVAVAPPSAEAKRGEHWNERILHAIGTRTKVVALGHVHWADGTRFHLQAIRKRTREVGALLIIDGTQSVGAMPFSWTEIEPDALICAGYKWLMGPYSFGLACYGPYFDNGVPIEENWINRKFSEDFTGLVNYQSDYQPGALRYEVGEHSNFVLTPMMVAALQQVLAWQPERVQTYCERISEGAIRALREHHFWIEEHDRGHHLFGIRLPKHKDLNRARQALQQAAIHVSFRGDCIRVAPHLYNSAADLNRLAKLLIQS